MTRECNFYPLDTFPEITIGGPRNNHRRSPKYPLVFPELSSSFPEISLLKFPWVFPEILTGLPRILTNTTQNFSTPFPEILLSVFPEIKTREDPTCNMYGLAEFMYGFP